MNHVVILGAGFSYALSEGRMPLTDALGTEIARRLRLAGVDVPASFSGGRFETWLSRLAEPQPDLDEVANARNHALFLQISELVREVLLEAQNVTVRDAPPWAFQRFIGALHARRSTVATFNYDTLVEHLVGSQWRVDWTLNNVVRGHHTIQDRPPVPEVQTFREGSATTFQLLKLHGSVDTFWVSGDTTGATINRLGNSQRWTEEHDSTETRRLRLPGRVPFIVPPAAAKSAFYANPLTRQLWRDAAQALHAADTIDVVGYSMPATDLVTTGMLADTLARGAKSIRVVNPAPGSVVDHLVSIGCDRSSIEVVGGADAIGSYVDALEAAFTPLDDHQDDVRMQLEQRALLMVGVNLNHGAAVSDVRRDPSDNTVARVRIETLTPHSHINRLRTPGEHVSSLVDLLGSSPPRRIIVEFDGGLEAAVVEVSTWGASEGHHGNWLRLVPSAIPLHLLPGR
ncbi:hypothetical protein [Nocardioides sp.]|uniref:hypothetical protein n=1 Tax=Nocardioides sp. TaxID=35761 RepID=UPI0035B3884B